MYWNINTLIPLFAIIIYGILFLLVSLTKPQTQERRGFRVYLLTMVLWSTSSFVTMTGWGDTLFWFRLMSASATFSMPAMFHFVQVFFNKKKSWANLIYIYGIIAAFLTLATNWVVISAEIVNKELIYELNSAIALISGPAYLAMILSFFELVIGYRVIKNPIQKNRIRYLMVGLGLIIIASVVNFTPLGKYPIDIAANSLTALLIAYAILKHQLLDISVVIRKGLLYFIPTTLIGASYFLIISLSLKIFQAYSGIEIFLLSMVVAITTAIILQPIRDMAQSWIDKLFFREKYNSGMMLQRVSRTASKYLDANLLANMILDEIETTLHIKSLAFFIKQKRSNDFILIAQKGLDSGLNIHLKADHPLIFMLSSQEEVLTRADLDILPQFKSLWSYERYALDQIEAEIFIPLKLQENLVGILCAGQKLSEENYSKDDQLILTTLANQTAVAIENARLYSLEQNRRKELDALNQFTRELITTDDPEYVLNQVVKHALEIVHVTFARIYIIDDNKSIICKAGYPVENLEFDLNIGKPVDECVTPIFQQALTENRPVIINKDDAGMNSRQSEALLLEHVYSICICPLRVGDEDIGILELAERRNSTRESLDTRKITVIETIADQAASALHRVNLHEQLEESFVQTVLALANALDARDHYTNDHGEKLTKIAKQVAIKLECPEKDIDAIHWAMQLHDIGKIGIPDNILRKPGPLTSEEWELMKRHPEIGANIVEPVKIMQNVAPLIRYHHEKYDGSGYPEGLKSTEIPIGARILSLVDAYGAITDERVYQKARSHEEAMHELKRCTGSQFDPVIMDAFINVIKEFRD